MEVGVNRPDFYRMQMMKDFVFCGRRPFYMPVVLSDKERRETPNGRVCVLRWEVRGFRYIYPDKEKAEAFLMGRAFGDWHE